MSKIKYLLALLLVLIFQISFVNLGNFFGLRFNFLLVLTSYLAHLYGRRSALVFTLITGLIYDILLSPSVGLVTLPLTLVALMVSEFRKYIYTDSPKIYISYILIANILYNVVLYLLMYFLSLYVGFDDLINSIFSSLAVNNIIVTVLVHYANNFWPRLLAIFDIEKGL